MLLIGCHTGISDVFTDCGLPPALPRPGIHAAQAAIFLQHKAVSGRYVKVVVPLAAGDDRSDIGILFCPVLIFCRRGKCEQVRVKKFTAEDTDPVLRSIPVLLVPEGKVLASGLFDLRERIRENTVLFQDLPGGKAVEGPGPVLQDGRQCLPALEIPCVYIDHETWQVKGIEALSRLLGQDVHMGPRRQKAGLLSFDLQVRQKAGLVILGTAALLLPQDPACPRICTEDPEAFFSGPRIAVSGAVFMLVLVPPFRPLIGRAKDEAVFRGDEIPDPLRFHQEGLLSRGRVQGIQRLHRSGLFSGAAAFVRSSLRILCIRSQICCRGRITGSPGWLSRLSQPSGGLRRFCRRERFSACHSCPCRRG